MPTFDQPKTEMDAARAIIASLCDEVPLHASIRDRKVRIDLLFAFAEVDEKTGKPLGCALKHQGIRALAIVKKIGPADRCKGQGDCEIRIDGDWWKIANVLEQRAVLDHELTHICVRDKDDDYGRPKIVLRDHDFQVGWFASVAERHGMNSVECKQAAEIRESAGQYFWPALTGEVEVSRVARLEIHSVQGSRCPDIRAADKEAGK